MSLSASAVRQAQSFNIPTTHTNPMRRKIIPYLPHLKELAAKLRKNMTLPEVLLWHQLKQKQMEGQDFDRQRPIDQYIVDFYCKDFCGWVKHLT